MHFASNDLHELNINRVLSEWTILGALYMVTDISIRKDIPNKSVLDTQVASVCLLNNLFLFAKAIYWPVTATLLPYH